MTELLDFFWTIGSIVLLMISFVTRPTIVKCPDGWYADSGVRRSGAFSCARTIVGNPDNDGVNGHPEQGVQSPARLLGKVYCTGGALPIIVDQQTVGCSK